MGFRRCSLFTLVFAFGMTPGVVFSQVATGWELGAPGRVWPIDGVGGGPDVDFVQEAGQNDPPGDPNSPSAHQQADDDYYFSGEYPPPIGVVALDEIAMERAFATLDNDLRIHFNLPADLNPNALVRFSFEANNLDQRAKIPDPRYGVEVTFNGHVILAEIVIRPADLNTVITTEPVTLSSVEAQLGPGGDNVIWLHGGLMADEGGGNWMGMDYHALEVNDEVASPVPTLSEWGMIVLSLVLVAIGGLFVRRRRPSANQAG